MLKRISVLFFTCLFIFLIGCNNKNEESVVQNNIVVEPSEEIETTEKLLDEVFDISVSFANWSEESTIYLGGLNREKMYVSSVQHLPIYKFDTAKELEQFKRRVGEYLSIDSGYNEIPSFSEVVSKYDEDFFYENTLMLVYVPANTGSYRFGVNSVYRYNDSFCIHVERTNSPEVVTDDMAGWFITLCVPDGVVKACTEFDADLNNIPEEDWGIELLTENVTPIGLTLVFNQSGGKNVASLYTGSDYVIQRLENNDWIDVPAIAEVAWNAIALIIEKDSTTTFDVNWEFLYGELPKGNYRIGKEIMNFRKTGDYDKKMMYAYFELD